MSGFSLFHKAYLSTRRQMGISILYLAAITFILAIILWLAERQVQPDFSFWDAFIWPYEKYIGDPGKIVDDPLMSPVGKVVGTLVGILGVAIFAVPAGLAGSGLIDAMNEEKREKELEELRKRIHKAFLRDKDKIFSEYLRNHPDERLGKDDLYFVPQEIPVYKLQARQNMDLKDIIDCCKEYPEIRLKNMAQIGTTIEDLFVVENSYLNRCYGACIERGSRLTIVSTSSYAEKGTGWFAYYWALFGNFNFISKDVEVDVDDQDPFYNLNPMPRHDMKTLEDVKGKEKENKKLVEKLTLKQAYRDAYFKDLHACGKNNNDSWYIVIKEHKTNAPDDRNIYLTANKKDGTPLMIDNADFYNKLCQEFSEMMKVEENLNVQTDLYSLKEGYAINQMTKKYEDMHCNSFVMRPASDVMNNSHKLIVAHRIARFFSEKLDGNRDMRPEDKRELHEEGFGFQEDEKFEISKKKAEEAAKKMGC